MHSLSNRFRASCSIHLTYSFDRFGRHFLISRMMICWICTSQFIQLPNSKSLFSLIISCAMLDSVCPSLSQQVNCFEALFVTLLCVTSHLIPFFQTYLRIYPLYRAQKNAPPPTHTHTHTRSWPHAYLSRYLEKKRRVYE